MEGTEDGLLVTEGALEIEGVTEGVPVPEGFWDKDGWSDGLLVMEGPRVAVGTLVFDGMAEGGTDLAMGIMVLGFAAGEEVGVATQVNPFPVKPVKIQPSLEV